MYKRVTKKLMLIMFMTMLVLCPVFIGNTNFRNVRAEEVMDAGIDVKKIDGISDDFIMGMDVSSYVAVTDSGVVFKDFNGNALDGQGFFSLLKSCGINYIRVRVWNDPYDEDGNGYGGGNNDIKKAALIGKYATNAGMKLLVDFHYSDFWADPAKQMAPKAWAEYTVDEKADAIYKYTKDSLDYLKNQGIDVGMVQIGNETTGSMCGVSAKSSTDWKDLCKLFSAGSKAVRDVDGKILVALHFTDAQNNRYATYASNLKKNNVDYDVFASSFYPEWHGALSNLQNQLNKIADSYGKKVMVVETSYPYSLEDFDGHDNTINKWKHENPPIKGCPEASVQGQADFVATVIKMVAETKNGIGVCYWEGAWNSVGNPYVGAGNWNEKVMENNRLLWEKHGSGWATSYAGSYDNSDAFKWYGGCAVDNQSFFDVNGQVLASLNVFKYVRTGANAENPVIQDSTENTMGSTETTLQENELTTSNEENSTTLQENESTTLDKEAITTFQDESTTLTESESETTSDLNDEKEKDVKESTKNEDVKEDKEGILWTIVLAGVLLVAAVCTCVTVFIIKRKGKLS